MSEVIETGKVYHGNGFPSTEGNDPHRVCRDIRVSHDTYLGRGGAREVKTTELLTTLLRTRTGDAPSDAKAPPFACPQIEACSSPSLKTLNPYPSVSSIFFSTLHECFQTHHPVGLSPEVLMYLVLHEVSICVKQNPEKYAHLFTQRMDGAKEVIRVQNDRLVLGNPESPWHEVLGTFQEGLQDRVPAGIMQHALPDFSTHTVTSQAASLVAFMDAASPYFVYIAMTLCGIPRIRLFGRPEDYTKMMVACAALREVFADDLGAYFDHLMPILKKIATQAEGEPLDTGFWSSIYKYKRESGADEFSGWASNFVNYVLNPETQTFIPRPLSRDGQTRRNIPRGALPLHVSRVDFIWEYYGRALDMEFVGGILNQEMVDGFLTPRLGYAVIHKVTV